MVDRVYRSKNHPKLPDAFERLQAQAEEPETTSGVQIWLDQITPASSKPSVDQSRKCSLLPPPSCTARELRSLGLPYRRANVLPLRPTRGNQLPPPTRVDLKRKMPVNSDTNPRQPTRFRQPAQSASVDGEPSVKDKEVVAIRTSRKGRKPAVKAKEDVILNDVAGDTLRKKELPGLGESRSGWHLASRMEPSNDMSSGGRDPFPLDSPMPTPSSKRSVSPSKRSTSPSKRSGSPSKGLVVVDKRERMQFMVPCITFRTLEDTRENEHLEGTLQRLWQHVKWDERKFIPSAFKREIQMESDAPNSIMPSIPDDCFGDPLGRYAADDYALMRLTILDVLSSAKKYRHSGCTEAHWISVVVSPILNLIRRLKRYQKSESKLAVVDLTSVEISPSTLCPTDPDSLFKDLDKRIDAAIGLDLPSAKLALFRSGVFSEGVPSINQTASFVNFVPMFANIEVKRPNTNRDPLIQLGTWIAAEFTKRQREGYSLDMPVLAIEIVGDVWNLHMVFAPKNAETVPLECSFVGPIEMGSTISLRGIYQILHGLCSCADWGVDEYQTWCNEQILAKYGYVV